LGFPLEIEHADLETHPSGAKAHFDLLVFAARLNRLRKNSMDEAISARTIEQGLNRLRKNALSGVKFPKNHLAGVKTPPFYCLYRPG